MPALASKLSPRSEDFKANAAAMRALVDDLNAKLAKIGLGGGEAPRAKHLARGKLLPRDRVEMLLDPDTPFLEVAPLAALDMYKGDAPGAAPSYMPSAASGATSRKGVSGSSSISTRSRGSNLPRATCLARAASPPPCATWARRSFKSPTSTRMACALARKSSERTLSVEASAGMRAFGSARVTVVSD